jgi:hypothetical protein
MPSGQKARRNDEDEGKRNKLHSAVPKAIGRTIPRTELLTDTVSANVVARETETNHATNETVIWEDEYRIRLIAPSGKYSEYCVGKDFAARVALDAVFQGNTRLGLDDQSSIAPLTGLSPESLSGFTHVVKITALLLRDSGGDGGKGYGRDDLRRLYAEARLERPSDWNREIGLAINTYQMLRGDTYKFYLTQKALEEGRNGFNGLRYIRRGRRPRPTESNTSPS